MMSVTVVEPAFSQKSAIVFFLLTVLTVNLVPVQSKGFLVENGDGVDAKLFETEVQDAMGAMLGCGGSVDKEHLAQIEAKLTPMWRTLPKNSYDRLERRSLRYLTHRYFMKKSSLLIRGFEPSRPVNHSHWGAADILSQKVPGYVEAQLESRRALEHGFSLEDAAMIVAMLEQLIFDAESTLLEKAYKYEHKTTKIMLGQEELAEVLEVYLVNWMMGDDERGVRILLNNRSLLETTFPHWNDILNFAEGQLHAFDFARRRPKERKGQTATKDSLSTEYSFSDTHGIVGSITSSFASFWDSECASMKKSLVEMDTLATGRVKLSKFYGTALDSEWRFGESETYLRELGALDETSRWIGKQVIIPNYMQAASNCIVSTPHYLVCCMNECESLLGEIEEAIGYPVASPVAIMAIVGNMTSQTTLDDDHPPILKGALTAQLDDIGRKYSGSVPLHSRLFAQWLHYVFPRECPFPHKMGTATSATPTEFGNSYLAQHEEMHRHANGDQASNEAPTDLNASDGEWMSQWSEDEEFMVGYSGDVWAPWERQSHFTMIIMLALLVFSISAGVISVAINQDTSSRKLAHKNEFWTTKAHLV